MVAVKRPVGQGANIRLAGEDIASGARAVVAGSVLRPAEIGLLAAIGCAEVRVVPRVRVAVLTTGDELVDVSENRGRAGFATRTFTRPVRRWQPSARSQSRSRVCRTGARPWREPSARRPRLQTSS